MWTSKRKYRLARGVGRIIQMGRGFVIEINEVKFMISRDIGQAIRDAEESELPVGRPGLYNQPTMMKGITLPCTLWEKIGEPFSLNIYNLLRETLCQGKKL